MMTDWRAAYLLRYSYEFWVKTMRRIMIVGVFLALAGCCGSDEPACTQAQKNALGAMQATSSYHSYQAPVPVFTSCTTGSTGIANCLSY
jgi:hypothetical protein